MSGIFNLLSIIRKTYKKSRGERIRLHDSSMWPRISGQLLVYFSKLITNFQNFWGHLKKVGNLERGGGILY